MKTLSKILLLAVLFICTALPSFSQPVIGQSGFRYGTSSNGQFINNIIGVTGQVPYPGTKTGNALTSDSNFTRVDSSGATVLRCPNGGGGYNGISISATNLTMFHGNASYAFPLNATPPTTVKIHLGQSQITTMNVTPDTLIRIASNQFIAVQGVTVIYNYGTETYTNGVTLEAYYNGSSIATPVFTDNGINHNGASTWLTNTTLTQRALSTSIIGQPLIMAASGAQTGGDGSEDLYITYTVVTIP